MMPTVFFFFFSRHALLLLLFFLFLLKIALLPAGVLWIIILEHNRWFFPPAIWRVTAISAEDNHYFHFTFRLWKSGLPHLPHSLPENTGLLALSLLWCRRLCCLWTFILDVKFQRIITPVPERNVLTRPCSTLLCCQGDSIENYGHSSACAVWAPWM